ncbi:MAG: 3-oxoacyl-[acyl-carrier-protein] reductase [Verrucomicrobia bacterium]|nr:3-oxoacyl-[acyl-carrier-protein] reductase [Verrucomicrobiota bacterium]
MGLLDGKVAMVTGAAQGIGAAVAERLTSEGAALAALDINLQKAQETAERVRQAGGQAEAYQVDVSNTEAVKNVVAQVVSRFGRVDVLVNNAGVTRDGLLITMSEQDWDLVIAVNLKSIFNFTKAVSRQMMKQKSGAIINVSSVVGLMGNAGQINYAASKAGVIGATKSSAKELAARSIRVNAVAPGYIQTAMTDKLSEKARQALIDYIPAKQLGDPADVANAVLFLASDLSSYITGEVIRVDGGMAMG